MTTETMPVAVPLEPTSPIKPSEAIRLGCLTTEQVFGDFETGPGTACALGAMAIGYGNAPDYHPLGGPTEKVYLTTTDDIPGGCPACAKSDGQGVVPHLNDDHRWSRERIADWLEGLGL